MAPRLPMLATLGTLFALVASPAEPASAAGPATVVDPASPSSAAPQQGRSGRIQPRSTPRGGAQRGARAGAGGRVGAAPTGTPRTQTTPTGTGDRRTTLGGETPLVDNPFGAPPEALRRRYFQTADADGTGWLSFREAKGAIGFDAARFRVFDGDNDGRFTFDEYTEFLRREVANGRAPVVPRRPDLVGKQPPRDAEQLRIAYDVNLDDHISRLELDRILLDYGDPRRSISAGTMMERFDLTGDSLLELDELEPLANYLMPLSVDTGIAATAKPNARTVEDLFGTPIDRGENVPPQIVGPVQLFRRLDLDNDGYIELNDLRRLEPQAFSQGSLTSILQTLDRDFDNRLGRDELLDSMRPAGDR